MIELHLIGYTEDGEQLVFDLDADGEGRYTLAVDPDLLATVAALRTERVRRGRPVDERPAAATDVPDVSALDPAVAGAAASPVPDAAHATSPEASLPGSPAAATSEPPAPRGRWSRPAPTPRPRRGAVTVGARTAEVAPAASVPSASGTSAPGTSPPVTATPGEADGAAEDATPSQADAVAFDHRPSARAEPRAALSPAEIQRELRAGRSVGAVAAAAGVEPAWIERWLPPILAERERVLRDALGRTVDGTVDRLGDRVTAAFAARGIPDEETSWTAARRADGRWRVSVRYRDGGRARTATWTVRDEGGPIRPASPAAAELAPPATGRRR